MARLKTFLDIDPKMIGVIRGGKRKPTGIIDVALIQSLVRKGEVSDQIADYGHVVVDECHHLSAVTIVNDRGETVTGRSAGYNDRHPVNASALIPSTFEKQLPAGAAETVTFNLRYAASGG